MKVGPQQKSSHGDPGNRSDVQIGLYNNFLFNQPFETDDEVKFPLVTALTEFINIQTFVVLAPASVQYALTKTIATLELFLGPRGEAIHSTKIKKPLRDLDIYILHVDNSGTTLPPTRFDRQLAHYPDVFPPSLLKALYDIRSIPMDTITYCEYCRSTTHVRKDCKVASDLYEARLRYNSHQSISPSPFVFGI